MTVAIIGDSLGEDLVILLGAILIFGKRFPEMASSFGRKWFQFRRHIDELRAEIARPIRDEIERPLREAATLAKAAAKEAAEHADPESAPPSSGGTPPPV